MKAVWLWSMAITVVFAIGLLWFTEIPLGIPGEWTWKRLPSEETTNEVVLGSLQAGVLGLVFAAVAWFGLGHISTGSLRQVAGWLAGLMLASMAWLFGVQESPPDGFRLSKAPWVLYYPSMTGYFYKARYEVTDTRDFLSKYEALMAEGDVLHVGTHPPGMFVMYRGLIAMVDRHPGLVPVVNATVPVSAEAAFEQIESGPFRDKAPFTASDRAVIWLGALLAHGSVAFTMLPLFGLLRLWMSRAGAWKAICFWPLFPAVVVFLPKCDVLFTGLVVTFAWAWLTAVQRRSIVLGCVAGLLGWIGLCLSLVFLPIGLLAFLATAIYAYGDRSSEVAEPPAMPEPPSRNAAIKRTIARLAGPALGGGVAVIGITILLGVVGQINLLAVWVANYRNHAGFYAQYPRTRWLWVPVNALELILAIGTPVAVLAGIGLVRGWKNKDRRWNHALACAVSIVWGLLWLSGKNSGEAARLWIPLMPFVVCLLAVEDFHQAPDDSATDEGAPRDSRVWLGSLLLQAVVCVATVMRISGFHYGQ